jgi:cation-transporting ATPase E
MNENVRTEYSGLTTAEVDQRIARGEVNVTTDTASRKVWDIVRTNTFTRFNALLSVLFVIIMFVGQPIDGLFFIAVIINSGMGIVQELRAKRTLDRLSILSAPKVIVKRDGKELMLPSEAIVLDDLVQLKIGDQVPTDGVVTTADSSEIDEALLTGEADPVMKRAGDTVLSGSIVVAGSFWYKVTAVGDDAYAYKLTAKVKVFKKAHSELLEGTNKLLGYISLIILFVAPLLVWGQLTRTHVSFQEAAVRSIAAIVGMIPEGLVVLTSFAFVLASLTLARRKVLVQELPAVEGLARVDVICLDKTGTLTEGKIVFSRLELQGNADKEEIETIIGTFAAQADSPTLEALYEEFSSTTVQPSSRVAFNSKRKWSALTVKANSWILGAPEILFHDSSLPIRKVADTLAKDGLRVLALTTAPGTVSEKALPKKLVPQALVVLEEKIRSDAAETLAYFKEQGVELKVISGDNPRTVAAVAHRVGIDCDEPFDARELPSDIQLIAKILESHNVFGRVLPEQKQLFVKALQASGHVVAMTGDGVNDALALKDADIGIAMGNGAPATRAVARLVLLDSKFSHMPHVLGEGRRVIANIERVANLFVIKNVYNLLFALSVTVLALSFPFLPRHLSLISWLTIGIPAFFLALGPNNRRYVPGFLKRVLRFAVPIGVIVAVAAMYTYKSTLSADISMQIASSSAVISVVTIGLWVLACLGRPFKAWKVVLISSMGLIFYFAISWPWLADILKFSSVWPYNLKGFFVGIVGALIVEIVWRLDQRR